MMQPKGSPHLLKGVSLNMKVASSNDSPRTGQESVNLRHYGRALTHSRRDTLRRS